MILLIAISRTTQHALKLPLVLAPEALRVVSHHPQFRVSLKNPEPVPQESLGNFPKP